MVKPKQVPDNLKCYSKILKTYLKRVMTTSRSMRFNKDKTFLNYVKNHLGYNGNSVLIKALKAYLTQSEIVLSKVGATGSISSIKQEVHTNLRSDFIKVNQNLVPPAKPSVLPEGIARKQDALPKTQKLRKETFKNVNRSSGSARKVTSKFRNNVICFSCNKVGHIASECAWTKR